MRERGIEGERERAREGGWGTGRESVCERGGQISAAPQKHISEHAFFTREPTKG